MTGTTNGHEIQETNATVQAAPAIVADTVTEHVPPPAAPPVVAAVPDPPTPVDGLTELQGVVAGLATTVTALTETVTGLLPKDHSPEKPPWTHRGGNRNGNDNGE